MKKVYKVIEEKSERYEIVESWEQANELAEEFEGNTIIETIYLLNK